LPESFIKSNPYATALNQLKVTDEFAGLEITQENENTVIGKILTLEVNK